MVCQKGENIHTHVANHPAHWRNRVSVHGFMTGTRICSDAKGAQELTGLPIHAESHKSALMRLRKKEVWRVHQSLHVIDKDSANGESAQGFNGGQEKTKAFLQNFMRCKECSLEFKQDIFFCNNTKY
jgi:hypothetical protein